MKTRWPLLLVMLPLSLSACSNSLSFEPYSEYIQEASMHSYVPGGIYYRPASYGTIDYQTKSGATKTISSFRDLYSSTNNGRTYLNCPSRGKRKMLVIPVSFTDSEEEYLPAKRTLIQNAFFGVESKTTYESVASYYNKSSYGQLQLSGEVSDWFSLPYSGSEIKTTISQSSNASRYICGEAVKWYIENNDDVSDYDTDGDGYIDAVFIIYDYPKSDDSSSLFWAYTDHMNKNESISFLNGERHVTNDLEPYASSYSWASIDFLSSTNGNYADSHVVTHETGHLFGLQDYYSSGDYQPTGYMDIMDYNFGDHTGFSKMCLDWVVPKVLIGSGEVTIKPFSSSGDLLLIPSGTWNGTAYDEYLLLEYYSPTGLNQHDTTLTFSYVDSDGSTKTGRFFSTFGLKVYHVDARLAYLKSKSIRTILAFFDDPSLQSKLDEYRSTSTTDWCVDFGYSNDIWSTSSGHPVYHLLEKSGLNTFRYGYPGNDYTTLWKQGDTFGIDTFKNFSFYDGTSMPYTFEVTKMDANGATISFASK